MDIHFIGIVTGVDSSIEQFPLEKGLKFIYSDMKTAHQSIAEIMSMPVTSVERMSRDRNWANLADGKIATVEGIIPLGFNSTNSIPFWDALENLNDDIVKGYLIQTISFMRLYQQGMISLGDRWLYCMDNGKPQQLGSFLTSGPNVTHPHYVICKGDVVNLDNFVRDMHTNYPKDDRFVKSLNAFNRSYQMQFSDPDLAFLALDVSMECLLSKNFYKSRKYKDNVAKIVTKDSSRGLRFIDVQKDMDEYYDDRCNIAHNLGILDVSPIIPKIEGIRKLARICINESVQYYLQGLDPLDEAEKLTP